MKNFIEATEIKNIENPLIIDVRTGGLISGYDEYLKGHVKDSYFMDLEKDLSGKPDSLSGNHPFPDKEKFRNKLQSFGADNESHFIIYDDGNNYSAGRMWFLLKYFGLDKVSVVNGGLRAILKEGIPLTDMKSLEKNGHLTLKEHPEILSQYEEVKDFSDNPRKDKALVDSRSPERYLGNSEPLYSKSGHIPGSENYFFMDAYDEDGKVKDKETLKKDFKNLYGRDLIVSCGSGVTACANILAMEEAGLNPRLYIGSFSEWIKRGNEVRKEDETMRDGK